MGTLQFAASMWFSSRSENSVTAPGPYCEDMLSTPEPMPTSIMPERMALAISTHACRPEEHCRLRDLTAVDSGKPATSAAARYSVAPPPGASTQPVAMSSTRAGSILLRSRRALNVWARRSAAAVSLKPPLRPRVKGVRRAQVMTTSSGDLERIGFCPEPRWLET